MSDYRALVMILCLLACAATALGQGGGAGYALRFYGNGVNDIDRVKISIDDPANANPGPVADVGDSDFTIEFWMKALSSENTSNPVGCGANHSWIFGNIILDRDRYSQDRKFGISIAGGSVVFGVTGAGTDELTLCGTMNVLDQQWHHIAVQRRRADGWMWIYIDGLLQAQGNGPDGDVSYPDDGVPGNYCGGPCTNSDPFLVIGAEKHDAGPQYPSFSGWIDEVRLSKILRYATNFARPSAPFATDPHTVALYHFDEGSGELLHDASGAVGGPSPGVRRLGGSPPGPAWVPSDAPLTGDPPPLPSRLLEITLGLNQAAFRTGDTLRVGLRAQNPELAFVADFYFGVLLPDGLTVLFVTSLSPLNGVLTRLDSDPRTFQPLLANVQLSQGLDVTLPDFFVYTFDGGESPGTYGVFALLTPPGAFNDGRMEPGDLLVIDVQPFGFTP